MPVCFALMTALILAFFPAGGLCAGDSFITMDGGSVSPLLTAKEIRNGKEAGLEAAMPDPVQFILRRGSPNGTGLSAIYGDAGENLLSTLPPEMAGFDAYGELEDGFSIQFAIHDLNGDKKPGVLVATGDGTAILTLAVFVSTKKNGERFRCIGVIEGQNKVHVDANGVITMPYGSQGLFDAYAVSIDGVVEKK